jgi:hypothetical protein
MCTKRRQGNSARGPLTAGPRTVLVGLLLLLVAGGVGCRGGRLPTYRAGGRVKFAGGKPLTRGWVEFESVKQRPIIAARAEIQSDGSFELGTYKPGDGAIEGEHRAAVGVRLSADEADNPKLRKPPPVDRRFSALDSSGLQFTVTRDADKNRFEIVVEPPSAGRSN